MTQAWGGGVPIEGTATISAAHFHRGPKSRSTCTWRAAATAAISLSATTVDLLYRATTGVDVGNAAGVGATGGIGADTTTGATGALAIDGVAMVGVYVVGVGTGAGVGLGVVDMDAPRSTTA